MTGTSGSPDRAALAVGLAALAAGLAAVDAAIVRTLGGTIHPFVIGFFRAAFGALAVLPWVIARPALLRSAHPPAQHALRAGLKLLALVAFFAAFAQGPLTATTAIAFTSPILVVLGASALLGERLGPRRIAAAALGLLGALIVIGPWGEGATLAMGFAAIGASLTALIQIMLKSMSGSDSTGTLVAWNLLLTAPMALLPAIWFWTSPGWEQVGLLVVQGVLGAANMALMTHAFSLTDASAVAPVDFLRLPLVAILAFALWGEVAGPATWIGGALICGAALLALRATKGRAGTA
jgi:drug/metabolite transporter (DMT)-like permease